MVLFLVGKSYHILKLSVQWLKIMLPNFPGAILYLFKWLKTRGPITWHYIISHFILSACVVFLLKCRSGFAIAFFCAAWNDVFAVISKGSFASSIFLYPYCLVQVPACFGLAAGMTFTSWVTLLGVYMPGIKSWNCLLFPPRNISLTHNEAAY